MKTFLTTTMALAVLFTLGKSDAEARYYNSPGAHLTNWGTGFGLGGRLHHHRGLGVGCWRNLDGSITYIPRL